MDLDQNGLLRDYDERCLLIFGIIHCNENDSASFFCKFVLHWGVISFLLEFVYVEIDCS
jgi:hypothetical protein